MHIILCVTNDVVTDRRVSRIARSLLKTGSKVTVIGRAGRTVPPDENLPFHRITMRLAFRKGPLFYAEYNFRLLLHLLFAPSDVMVANDLDTLPAVFMAARIRRKIILYDSHEYFTEVPELVDRRFTKRIWLMMEGFFLPRIKYAYTVSNSIAAAYGKKYGLNMQVIRNLPVRPEMSGPVSDLPGRGKETKIILYQGSLNRGRGLELAIHAMRHMQETKLVIVGTGDVEKDLKILVAGMGMEDKVLFAGRISAEGLVSYTIQADLGISLERDTGLSYRYALPNKLFDYIQAEVPVVVSNLPEMSAIVKQYGIGIVTDTNDPHELARLFQEALHDAALREIWKVNLKKAAAALCWENEEEVLLELYRKAIGNG